MASRLIDKIRVEVRAGKGGDGALAYTAHKLKKLLGPGFPCGGNGGRGGDVSITSVSTIRSLGSILPVIQGGNGGHGGKNRMNGSPGIDAIIKVPIGVTVVNQETRKIVADLDKHNQTVVVAIGGAGGKGNNNVRPHEASRGETGDTGKFILELKIIADIGLVGFPNAGKSSLLQFISKASPRIAPYPFTTLSPYIGTVDIEGVVKIADLPGLVEEAHLNRGMGHEFLRHIERTKALLFVLDSTCQHWNPKETSSMGTIDDVLSVLRAEVELYDKTLGMKPWGVVINKIDPEAGDMMTRLEMAGTLEKKLMESESAFKGLVAISAKHGIGKKSVYDLIKRLVPSHDSN